MRILMMCLPDHNKNPRPHRMISFCCARGDEVHIISGATKNCMGGVSHHYVINPPSFSLAAKIMRKIQAFIRSYIYPLKFPYISEAQRQALRAETFNLIIVEDLFLLPDAFAIADGKSKILFDAREYYPDEYQGSLLFRIIERPYRLRLCHQYLPKCDGVMTVSEGLRRRYHDEFNITPALIRSTPPYADFPVRRHEGNIVRMVHHGAANRDRCLEKMIAAMKHLDKRFTLDFYLTGNPAYQNELRQMAVNDDRIKFHDPVPFADILPMLQNYDIGFYLLQPTGFNTEYALPNKFFEFLQARLMLAIGPSPDMATLIHEYGCGIVAPDFDPQSMAKCLNDLSAENIMDAKQASDRAARILCFEKESEKITALFAQLVPQQDEKKAISA